MAVALSTWLIPMKNKLSHKLCLIVLPLLLLACSQEQDVNKANGVSLDPVSFAEWDAMLGQYRGSIVVADLWATWCKPCIDRFPKMVGLHQRYGDRGVQFVSINFDDSQDGESLQKAKAFLEDVQANFDNVYFNENLIDAFAHMEVIALPVVVIYNQDGEEAMRLTNTDPRHQFTEADIEAAIDQLLAAN